MSDKLSLNNPVFWNFAGCSTVCLVKMWAMSPLTARQRGKKKIAMNPEDVAFHGEDYKVGFEDPDIERIRRNHLNDLENIPLFVLMGGLYVLTDPNPECAIWHFRLFTISRILHTVAYQCQLKQPTRVRGISFAVGHLMNISMAVQIFLKLMS